MSVWVLDLDGVVWLADEPIAGAAAAVARLRAAGERVVFVTNNSNPRVADLEAKLADHGIQANGDVITSGAVTATELVEPGERVLLCGGPGLREELERRGAEIVDAEAVAQAPGTPPPVDAVLVGFHRDFDYERMRVAAQAVRQGARFVATNGDPTYPTPEGLIPGCGAIAAGVAAAAGVAPTVAGKPHPPMAHYLRQRLGAVGTVVGDRADTDGQLARVLGWRFALVLSGATTRADLPTEPVPDVVAENLLALVERG